MVLEASERRTKGPKSGCFLSENPRGAPESRMPETAWLRHLNGLRKKRC